MKILSKQKSNDPKQRNSYLIRLENDEEFVISDEDYFSGLVYSLEEIDIALIKNFADNLLFKKAKEYAVKFLAYRVRSSGELRQKLAQQGFSEDIIEKAIDYSKENGYMDDERFAELYSNQLANSKMYARKLIKYELRKKGVSDESIEAVFENSTVTDEDVARRIIDKKFKRIDMSDRKQMAKMQNFFMSKGFSYDIIANVLNDRDD